MEKFKQAKGFSEILEESQKQPVVIFKYSSECLSSKRLSNALEKKLEDKNFPPIYLIVVQDQPTLSKNIAEFFDIKHESPQIIAVHKGKTTYTAHHNAIEIDKLKI